MKHLFLDLEDTVITPVVNGWDNTELINKELIKQIVDAFKPDFVHIFSFALHNKHEVEEFKLWVRPALESLLEVPICVTPDMDDMIDYMEDIPQRIWPLPARRINGIGPKAGAKLAALGIESIGDIAAKDRAWLVQHFGAHYGSWLHEASHGTDGVVSGFSQSPNFECRQLFCFAGHGSNPCVLILPSYLPIPVRLVTISLDTTRQSFLIIYCRSISYVSPLDAKR